MSARRSSTCIAAFRRSRRGIRGRFTGTGSSRAWAFVIRRANMHLVGRQLDPARVRRDLWRLAEWERRRGNREQVQQSQQ